MPRDDDRPIEFSQHARERLAERGIRASQVEIIVRHGAREADDQADFLAEGSLDGRWLEAPCLDLGDRILVKTVIVDDDAG